MSTTDHYEAYLFDAGGTLIIREPADDDVLLERWRSIGLHADLSDVHQAVNRSELWIGEQILRELTGAPRMPDEDFFRKVDEAALLTVFRQATQREIAHWLDCLQSLPKVKQKWQPSPGSQETLEALQALGIRMGVVSNFNESLPDLLYQFGLAPYFETIVCSALVGIEKPNPEILNIACRRMGVQPFQVLYIGDHPLDVLCAKQIGMAVVWLHEPGDRLPEYIGYQPDMEINDLAELRR